MNGLTSERAERAQKVSKDARHALGLIANMRSMIAFKPFWGFIRFCRRFLHLGFGQLLPPTQPDPLLDVVGQTGPQALGSYLH